MKKLMSVTLGLVLATTSVLAADSNLRASMAGEKCILVKAEQDPANKYEVLKGVTAINIFGEFSFMQTKAAPNGKIEFPNHDSIITFSFKNDQDRQAVGDQFFSTVQSTSFLTKNGKPTTIDQIENGFIVAYTHTYSLKQPMREMTVKATHSIAQITDHWASKDVVVEYTDIQKTPVNVSTFKGKFLFKCNDYDRAIDILK